MTSQHAASGLRPVLGDLVPNLREAAAFSAFVNIFALAVPIFVLQVYDRVVFHAGLSTLAGLVVGVAIVVLFDYIVRQARSRIVQRAALRLDVGLSRRLFDALMAMPLAALESRPAAYWQALFRDVDIVRNTIAGPPALLVCDLPFAVMFLALVAFIAPPVLWVLAVALPLFAVVAWRSATVLSRASAAERDKLLVRDTLIAEIINGRTVIKALALDTAMRPAWEERQAAVIEQAVTRGARSDGYAALTTTLTMTTSVAIIAVGAVAVIHQSLTIGSLIAANMLAGRLFGPLAQLVVTWRQVTAFRQSLARLRETFAIPLERQETDIRLELPRGEITAEALTFTFPECPRPAIAGVGFRLEPGRVHALVGRNGSGKSTLLKLLQGLYTPESGRVLLDGADIRQFGRAEIARRIGYVPQDTALFTGSIRDNIALRKPDADDAAIIAAAQHAGVHDFIIDLPDGYGAPVGEAGHRLSGGQRQRIALARALLGDPQVLLLDEPSSTLDRQGETELRDLITRLAAGRTVVLVSHSPMLLSACHRIIVLDRGRVVIDGAAADILPRLMPGAFARVASASTAASPFPSAATEAAE